VTHALRLADHDKAVDELNALAGLEGAELDETVVLGARPAPKRLDRGEARFHP
jgi:hypothetical protein